MRRVTNQSGSTDTGTGRAWLACLLTVPFAVVLFVIASLVAMALDEARSFGWPGPTDNDLDVAQMNRDEALGGATKVGGVAVLLVVIFLAAFGTHAWRRRRPFRYWFWPVALVLTAGSVPVALIL